MIFPRLRPTLELDVPLEPATLLARIEQQLREPDSPCSGLVADEHIEIKLRTEHRHFWSPQLVVVVEPHGGGSRLSGRFGPNSSVWSLFLAMYAFVILSALFGVFLGTAQVLAEERAWALVSIPVAAVLVPLIYLAAGVGQRLGRDQTDLLEQLIREAIRDDAQGRVAG